MSKSRISKLLANRFENSTAAELKHKVRIVPAPESPTDSEREPNLYPDDPNLTPEVSEARIRMRAYLKWEAAGKPAGDGREFWLAAEQELRRS